MGLGTGTQLGLAVARAIAELTNQPERAAPSLAQCIGRGKRSAIGVHGFDQGGFLIEGGKLADKGVSPLISRHNFPWRVYLIFPPDAQGVHGQHELEAFAALAAQSSDERATEIMSRIALLGMLPALAEGDLDQFGEALYDYNRRAGEMFQAVQGGIYATPWTESMVKTIRNLRIKGVGQSSWGPVVFAVVSPLQAMGLFDWLTRKKKARAEQIALAHPCNRGAEVTTE
jgi:beta-ribofuranosylaminobenzene 5'-phosphate synthase